MGTADAKATFTVELQDETSKSSNSATDALKKLQQQLKADTQALADMQRAMKNLQMGSSVNIQQFKDLKAKIDAKKKSIAEAQGAYLSLGGTFGKTAREGGKIGSLFERLQAQAKMMPGPLAQTVAQLGGMKSVLAGGVIALGIAAIAAAMVAVTAASIAAAAAILKYGIAQADARRAELLRLEGLTKLRFWYQATAGNATEMQAAIDRVSDSAAIGRDQVARYTEQLYRMGLRGQNLEDALEGVAIKAAVQGDAAASRFAGMAAGAALAGGSVRKLSDDVKARLGGVAAAQMLQLGVQTAKLKERIDRLFSGLKIEALLKAMKSVTDAFSQNTVTGKALKTLVEHLFQPMIDGIAKATPLVKRFFQGIVIGALVVEIALLKVRNWFKHTFGSSDILGGIDAQTLAVYAGAAAVGVLVAAVVGLAAAFTLLLTPVAAVAAALLGIGYAVGSAIKWITSVDWGGLGESIVQGIVSGIGGLTAAASMVKAMKALGGIAVRAFKAALGIASPSKVFAQVGLAIPQGVEQGIDAGKGGVDDSVSGMVAPPENAARAPARAGSGGVTFNIGDVHIHSSGERPEEHARDFRRELESILEGVAIQLGAMPAGA